MYIYVYFFVYRKEPLRRITRGTYRCNEQIVCYFPQHLYKLFRLHNMDFMLPLHKVSTIKTPVFTLINVFGNLKQLLHDTTIQECWCGF